MTTDDVSVRTSFTSARDPYVSAGGKWARQLNVWKVSKIEYMYACIQFSMSQLTRFLTKFHQSPPIEMCGAGE